jgi:ABC-2 type transport system ATP-binding protein
MICGLLTPDSGEGTCLGYDLLKESDKIKRRTGYMTQKFSYWEDLSVYENLAFVAEMFALNQPEKRIQQVLESMHLTSRKSQLAGRLSGGWKQRLALAACILHEPELLLLDEPTAGVDPQARREFWDSIHELAASGLTVLVSTHYMDEAERCHAILYIAYGHLMVEGTVEEVVAHAGLTTWTVRGANLISLMREIENDPAISTIAPFGETLHISGTDSEALEAVLSRYRRKKGLSWKKAEPSLEDAFIHYMNRYGEKGDD